MDYIGLCHPGLTEQIGDLSALLPDLEEHGLPADKRLVIETIPRHELSGHPLEGLFQFSNDHDSEPLDGSVEETSPIPVAADDASPVDGTGDSYFDHSTMEAWSYDLDPIGILQDPLQDDAFDFPSGTDSGTPTYPSLEPCSDDYPLPPLPPSKLWTGDCEFNLSGEAIKSRDKMVHNR